VIVESLEAPDACPFDLDACCIVDDQVEWRCGGRRCCLSWPVVPLWEADAAFVPI